MQYLVRFLHQHKDQTIKTDLMPQRGKRKYNLLRDAFKQPAVIRVAVEDKKIRIIKEDFKRWMYDEMKGAGYGHIITELLKMGATEGKASIDAGCAVTTGRQVCMDFSMTAPLFKQPLSGWLD